MKNTFFLLIIISYYSFSQTKNYDIYILLDDTIESNIIHNQNDTLLLQVFVIKEQISHKYRTYFIDNKGDLKTDIQIKGNTHSNAFNLIYKNINDSNNPVIIKSKNVRNLLKYPADFKNQNINDMYKLLNEADRLFIIETDKNFGYYLAKKVEIGQRLGGF